MGSIQSSETVGPFFTLTGKKRRATREGEQKEMYEDQDLMALKEEQGQEQGKEALQRGRLGRV